MTAIRFTPPSFPKIEDFYFLRKFPKPFGNPVGEIHIPNFDDPNWPDIEDHAFQLKDPTWPIGIAVGGKLHEAVVYWDSYHMWTWQRNCPVMNALTHMNNMGMINDFAVPQPGWLDFHVYELADKTLLRFHGPLIRFRNEEAATLFKILLY